MILSRTSEPAIHSARLQQTLEVADALGARIINISLSMPTLPNANRPPLRGTEVPEMEYQRSARLIADLAQRAHKVGIGISLELHDDGLLDSPELCTQFLGRIKATNVGVNPDLGNIRRGPGPPPDWESALKLLAPRTNYWHVKNYRNREPVPLWQGDINYGRAFAIMNQVGYEGWVSIESYFGDVLDIQERSLEYLKRLAATAAAAPANEVRTAWVTRSST